MFMPKDLAEKAQAKQKTAIMFDPNQEREAKRKRMLAELLIQKGSQPLKNEQAGGMTVKRSPWENINQAAQLYAGQAQLGAADEQMAEAEKRRQQMIMEALSNPDQMQAAQILAQDPNTSEAAIRMYSDVLGDQRRMEQAKEIAGIRAASGGNTPAAIQIANEVQAALQNGDIERANMLYEIGKYQDRGIQRFGQPTGGYMPQGQMQIPQGGTPPFVPQNPPNLPPAFGGLPIGGEMGADPLQEHAQAVMQQQQKIGASPMQRPQFQPMPMAGYGEAVGSIAAAKKGAEERAKLEQELNFAPQIEGAKSDAKYMAEGRQALPKMERALQGAMRSNQNIMRVVGQVRNDAERAFTTGFTGSIANAVPGTPAYDLKQNLNTLRANAAFDTLQNMRNNSPTGGALGAISEKELDLLESAYTNLSNSQSYEQFMQNLSAFEQQNQASLAAMQQAYEQDYQRFGGQSDRFLPAPNAAQPAAQQPSREAIINQLRQNGIPEERINQYLQAKGL